MSRLTLVALVAALALPGAARAHEGPDREFDDDWEYIDPQAIAPEVDVHVDGDEGDGSVSFETFEENLAPHGEWVSVSSYGRVWRPRHVRTGWRPYYDGSWQWTDEGWLWVSAEPWGWATYHYGRWAYDSFYGWVWVPGYQWAPAWVSWRIGADFIGWAPLGPGFSVHVTHYPVVYDHWVFVPCNRFVAMPVPSIAYVGHHVRGVWAGTHPAPPRASVFGAPAPAWGGAPRPFIERRVGRTLTPVRVQPVATPQAAAAAPRRAGVVPVFRPDAARPQRAFAPVRPGQPVGRAEGDTAALPGLRSAPSPGRPQTAPPGAAPRRAGDAPAPRGQGNGRGAVAPAPRGQGSGSAAVAPAPPPASAPAQRAAPATPPAPVPRAAPAAPSRERGDRGGGSAPAASRGDGGGRGDGSAPAASRGDGGGRGGGFAPAPSRGGGRGEGGGGGGRGEGGGRSAARGWAVPQRQ
jgi:hypothetical protein